MSTQKKQYVYRLMKCKCSCSAGASLFNNDEFYQNLNLPKDHGILFSDMEHPLMNANDHVSIGDDSTKNIFTFGRCKSQKNPGGFGANLIMPFFGPMILKATAGVKCDPMTLTPWLLVDEDYFVGGAPALTIESKLACYYGGIITVEAELENEKNADSTEEEPQPEDKDARELLPSEVQEQIQSFCDGEASDGPSRADQELAIEQAQMELEAAMATPTPTPYPVPTPTPTPTMSLSMNSDVDITMPTTLPSNFAWDSPVLSGTPSNTTYVPGGITPQPCPTPAPTWEN